MTAWRATVITMATVGIIIWLIWVHKNKEQWGVSIAPLTYFAHTIVMYLCATYGSLDPMFINGWSNALRLHGIFIGIGFGLVFLTRGGRIWMRR